MLIFLVGGVYLAGNLSGENPPIGGVPSPSGSAAGGPNAQAIIAEAGCQACHGEDLTGGVGPTCTAWPMARPARTSRTCPPIIPMTGPTCGSLAPVRRSRIRDRMGMPPFGEQLSPEEIATIVDYLMTLE